MSNGRPITPLVLNEQLSGADNASFTSLMNITHLVQRTPMNFSSSQDVILLDQE